jgi:hypothetical protein
MNNKWRKVRRGHAPFCFWVERRRTVIGVKGVFWEPDLTVRAQQWFMVTRHKWRGVCPSGNMTLLGDLAIILIELGSQWEGRSWWGESGLKAHWIRQCLVERLHGKGISLMGLEHGARQMVWGERHGGGGWRLSGSNQLPRHRFKTLVWKLLVVVAAPYCRLNRLAWREAQAGGSCRIS